MNGEAHSSYANLTQTAFGGDPDHIVFGGHSSGSVQLDLYLWNHPKTWLKGAVQMSANAISGPAYAPTNVALDVVAAEVGCGAGDQGDQLECLRNISIYDIQTTFFNSTSNTCSDSVHCAQKWFQRHEPVQNLQEHQV